MPVRKPVNVRSVLMELPPGDTAQNHTKKGHYPKQPRRVASNPRDLRAGSQNLHGRSMAERLTLQQFFQTRSVILASQHRPDSVSKCAGSQ